MKRPGVLRSPMAVALATVAIVALAFAGGRLTGAALPGAGIQAALAANGSGLGTEANDWTGPWASAVRLTVGAAEQGEVRFGERLALTILTSAGGLSPYERAQIAVMRINSALEDGARPSDFIAAESGSLWTVQAIGRIIVTVDAAQASAMGRSPAELAAEWASAIAAALRGETPPTEGVAPAEGSATPSAHSAPPAATPASQGWVAPEPYDDKLVPVLSILEGIGLGMARVNGPRSAIADVQGVAQLETHFQEILEIDIYVPISTKVPGKSLARVQGVGVTGLADIKL